MNNQNNEIMDIEVVSESHQLAILADDEVLRAAIAAEARIKAFDKIKKLSLQITSVNDWCNLGGKPYLQDTGTEKIAALFSPKISKPIITQTFMPDGHYTFYCDGEATWGGKTIPVMGSRSSKDKFFVQYDYVEEGGKRKRVELSTEELLSRIDPGDVRKSALTNYRNNAIKDVLGLEGLTWADLESAGISKAEVSSVEYGAQEESPETKDRKTEAEKMLIEMYGKNYGQSLKKLTAWTTSDGKEMPGKTSLNNMSEKQLNVVYGKIKTAHEEWKKGAGDKKESQETRPQNELLGISSKEYTAMKSAMEKATTGDRLDKLLADLNGTFNDKAIEGLIEFAKSQRERIKEIPF